MNAPYTLPHEASNAISHNICHGCGLCAMQCPTQALGMERHYFSATQCRNSPVFSPQLCVHCGRCAAVCPAGTIFEYRTEHILHKVREEGIEQMVFICDGLNRPPAAYPLEQATCEHCAVAQDISLISAYKTVRLQDTMLLPPRCHLEVVRCTGRLGARYFLRLALLGVRNIVIFACPPARCQYAQGRPAVLEQAQALVSMLEDYGVAPVQIRVLQQDIATAAELQKLLNDMC